MTSQPLWSRSFILTWIFVYFLPSVCSGKDAPKLYFTRTVFVAFEGEDLSVDYTLKKQANQSNDVLSCSDPSKKEIYRDEIRATTGKPLELRKTLVLKDLDISGEYTCKYQTATAYCFLRLRDHSFPGSSVVDMPQFIILLSFTGALLIFSVLSTVYLFRGHWKVAKVGVPNKELKPDKGKMNEREDSVDVTASSSCYASLEHRPRSIYDVLDHSAANVDAGKRESTHIPKTAPQTEDEGVFDSVYENL